MSDQPSETPEPDNKPDDLQPKSYERVIAVWTMVLGASTIALVIATAVSAYFLYVTDHTLKDQLSEVRSASQQTERTIAAFEQLANATVRAADNQALSSERLQRAYIQVEPKTQISWQDGNLLVDVIVKNKGITPAYNLTTKTRVAIFEKTPTPEQVISEGGEYDLGRDHPTIFPEGVSALFVFYPFGPEEIGKLKRAGSFVVLCAEVDYTDIFQKNRRTTNCSATGLDRIADKFRQKVVGPTEVMWIRAHDYAD